MMQRTKAYILAARPRTLTASVSPVLIGFSLAGWSAIMDHRIVAIVTLTCAVLLQIIANLINDHLDHKHQVDNQQERIGPRRVVASGLLSAEEVRRAYIACILIASTLGMYLVVEGGLPIIAIGISSLVFAYAYTGGPKPLSHLGMGEVLAFIFFGPVAVWGSWYLLTNQADLLPVMVGVGPGAIAWQMMAINNLRDRKSDSASNKQTLAVKHGEQAGRWIALSGLALSVVVSCALAVHISSPAVALAGISSLLFFKHWRRVAIGPIDERLNASLAASGAYLFVYALILSIALLQ